VLGVSLLDAVGVGIAVGAVVALIGRAGRNLRRLAEPEPAS